MRLLESISTVWPIVLPVFLPFILTTVLMASAGQIFGQSLLGGAQRAGMAYLGVYLGDINEDRAKQLNLPEVRGVMVGKVEAGSPAAIAGLLENDVILAFNGQPVQNRPQFYQLLIESRPGSKAVLGIRRGGEDRSLPVELSVRRPAVVDERQRAFGEANAMLARADDLRREAAELEKKGDEKAAIELLDEEKELRKRSEELRSLVQKSIDQGQIPVSPAVWRQNINLNPNRYYLGIIAVPLTEQLAAYFKVTQGVLVTEVRAGGAAERAGVRAGDCVVAVNSEPVTSTSDLNRLIDELGQDRVSGEKTGVEFNLVIVRDRNEQRIKVKIEPR